MLDLGGDLKTIETNGIPNTRYGKVCSGRHIVLTVLSKKLSWTCHVVSTLDLVAEEIKSKYHIDRRVFGDLVHTIHHPIASPPLDVFVSQEL